MSLRDAGNAIANRLTGDTLASNIASIAGATVTLVAGQGASWAKGDILHLTGNNLPRVGTVTLVAGDVLTLDRSPAATTPGAGAQVRGGFANWVRPASGTEALLYVEPLIGEDPSKAFEDPDVTSNCQARLRPLPSRGRTSQHREEYAFELRVDGRDIEWCEGLLARAAKLLRSRPTELSAAAHDAWNLSVGAPAPIPKDTSSGLCRYTMPLTAVVALALVA